MASFLFNRQGKLGIVVQDSRPNADALGIDGGGVRNGEWIFSQCIELDGSHYIKGQTLQPVEKKDAKQHLHLFEDEVEGYMSGRTESTNGILGKSVVDRSGTTHIITDNIGGVGVTPEQCIGIYRSAFPHLTDPTAREYPRVVQPGGSKDGTGNIVTIHGHYSAAGGAVVGVDMQSETDNGGNLSFQFKVKNLLATSSGSTRVTRCGAELLEGIVNHGVELVLGLFEHSDGKGMTAEFYNLGEIVRMQAKTAGDDLLSGPWPLSAPWGKPGGWKGEDVIGGGRMPPGRSPFYLKYLQDSNKVPSKTGFIKQDGSEGSAAPRRPMVYSKSGLRKFVESLPAEKRERLHSPKAPFDPEFLPSWIGDCIY